MRFRLSLGILAILVLSVLSAFVVFDALGLVKISRVFPFRLGLDLQGGTHLVYEGDLADIATGDRDDAMDSVRGVIERRVNAFGVAEPVVQRSGDNRLIVELPGVKDINEAVRQIGLTPFLDFREENPEYIALEDPTEVDFNQFYRPTGLSGKHLERAEIVFDPNNNTTQISLHFDDEGKDLFAQITERNVGQTLAIFLDGVPISAPVVQQQITAGQAVITGKFTIEEARELMQRLNSGALPVPIKLLEQENIGPSLGAQSIEKSVVAGILGFLSIVVFMLVYYRLPGLIASLALVVYVFLVLAIFKLLSITLGIGIVLSMFTAIVVSRTFLRALMSYDLTRHTILYGHKGAQDV